MPADISSLFPSEQAGRHCESRVCPDGSNKVRVRYCVFSFHLHKTSYRSILLPDSALSHHGKPFTKGEKCGLGDIQSLYMGINDYTRVKEIHE